MLQSQPVLQLHQRSATREHDVRVGWTSIRCPCEIYRLSSEPLLEAQRGDDGLQEVDSEEAKVEFQALGDAGARTQHLQAIQLSTWFVSSDEADYSDEESSSPYPSPRILSLLRQSQGLQPPLCLLSRWRRASTRRREH